MISKDFFKKNTLSIILAAVIIILILLPLTCSLTSSYSVVIKNRTGQYYKAKKILIAGDRLFCLKDSKLYRRRWLIKTPQKGDFSLSVISMKDIALIEIIPDPDEPDEDIDIPAHSLGIFKINASGHVGYLYLQSRGGRIYGSVRFPNWAKGTYEPCKGLRIYGNTISFTRSVTTVAEMRRVGAPSYFTQVYSGTYSNNGNLIKGYYLRGGAKHLWQAKKIK